MWAEYQALRWPERGAQHAEAGPALAAIGEQASDAALLERAFLQAVRSMAGQRPETRSEGRGSAASGLAGLRPAEDRPRRMRAEDNGSTGFENESDLDSGVAFLPQDPPGADHVSRGNGGSPEKDEGGDGGGDEGRDGEEESDAGEDGGEGDDADGKGAENDEDGEDWMELVLWEAPGSLE